MEQSGSDGMKCERVDREGKGRYTYMYNCPSFSLIQTIQNNLERSEFETKSRLGSKIDALERELVVYKQKLASEEERRGKMMDAYETQVCTMKGIMCKYFQYTQYYCVTILCNITTVYSYISLSLYTYV